MHYFLTSNLDLVDKKHIKSRDNYNKGFYFDTSNDNILTKKFTPIDRIFREKDTLISVDDYNEAKSPL